MSLVGAIRNCLARTDHKRRCVTQIIIGQNIEDDRLTIFFHHQSNKIMVMVILRQRGIVANTLNRDPEGYFVKQEDWIGWGCRWSTLISGADSYVKVTMPIRRQLDQHRRIGGLVNRGTRNIGIDIANNSKRQIDINCLNRSIRWDINYRYRVSQ